jgi:AAA domain
VGYPRGEHPGAVWHKCDFQCHSPRDRRWIGTTNLPGGSEELELARNEWADSFVGACISAKLTAVAITDHHDICLASYVKSAAKRSVDGIMVFCGVEITCSDNCQCLVLFDPECSEARQLSLLAMAGNIECAHAHELKTCLVSPARCTISELFEVVSKEPLLRDHCLLLPHFSNDDAHKSLNEEGHHSRFANLPCDGVYIERPYSELDPSTLEKIQGKIPQWGDRRRAILATGDNRSEAWGRLGAHDCWIKLGEYSVEALRQALLADEARITFTPPDTPPEQITSLTVQSILTGGLPLKITFNAGFTAIIGGRGSGKTALLEYLRFALGRTESDINPDRKGKKEREAELINDTLADGYVEVMLEREGVHETWRRTLATRATITCTAEDGSQSDLTLSAARERFRARAFYQKGLSNTMTRRPPRSRSPASPPRRN